MKDQEAKGRVIRLSDATGVSIGDQLQATLEEMETLAGGVVDSINIIGQLSTDSRGNPVEVSQDDWCRFDSLLNKLGDEHRKLRDLRNELQRENLPF